MVSLCKSILMTKHCNVPHKWKPLIPNHEVNPNNNDQFSGICWCNCFPPKTVPIIERGKTDRKWVHSILGVIYLYHLRFLAHFKVTFPPLLTKFHNGWHHSLLFQFKPRWAYINSSSLDICMGYVHTTTRIKRIVFLLSHSNDSKSVNVRVDLLYSLIPCPPGKPSLFVCGFEHLWKYRRLGFDVFELGAERNLVKLCRGYSAVILWIFCSYSMTHYSIPQLMILMREFAFRVK